MSKESLLNHFKRKQQEKAAGNQKGQQTSKFKKELSRELSIGPNESMAERFPDEYEKLKSEILARLPRDNPMRNKMAMATARYMLGDAAAKVENQIGMNYAQIHHIMGVVFPDQKEMQSVLETTLLNNAVLANAIFMTKAHEMSPKDAAVSAGIFAQRFIEMKKDREGTDQPQADFKLVVQLQATLADLNTIKQIPGKVIENE